MREKLFRGKRIDNRKGEWADGFYVKTPKQEHGCLCDFIAVPQYDDENKYFSGTDFYLVDSETVCQYTGLIAYWNDGEEWEEVWEHDLLEVEYAKQKVTAEVKYECGMFILVSNKFADGYIPLFDVVFLEDGGYVDGKVIGNIFDNPELMKGSGSDE